MENRAFDIMWNECYNGNINLKVEILLCKGDNKMTTREKEIMIKDMEYKWENFMNEMNQFMWILRQETTCGVPKKDIFEARIRREVTDIMQEIGIPAHLSGYKYLREAIVMFYMDPKYLGAMTKLLYPEVASLFETTDSKVQRSMKHAINWAWEKTDRRILYNYFGYADNVTNSEFIAKIADIIRLQNNE